jgi:hypothetical protein
MLAQASRLNFSTRLFNLIVTNIPGPQMPLYVLGRPLEDVFPVAFLPKDHALAIAIMSYNGGIDFGLLGDYDALPDIDLIAEGIAASLAELLDIARGFKPKPKSRPRSKPSGADGAKSASNGGAAAGNGASAPANRDESAAGAKGSGSEEPRPILPPAHGRPKRGPAADMRAKQRQRGSQPARKRSSES